MAFNLKHRSFLTGDQWLVATGLSLLAPAVVAVDKVVQFWGQRAQTD
jgi:hypothetical protein